MRRAFLLLVMGAIVAIAAVYALRRAQQQMSSAAVASLLPKETVAFIHVPDFNQTMEQWHRSDIYQIYHEPAVQEFLHKSGRGKNPPLGDAQDQLKQLEARDA